MIESPRPARGPVLREREWINLAWLIRLRWAAFLGQLGTVLMVGLGVGVELPWSGVLSVLAFEVLSNGLLELWTRRARHREESPRLVELLRLVKISVMAVDVLLLSILLYQTGGVGNPFSVFYVVQLVLAAVLLRPSRAVLVSLLTVLCYGTLLITHREFPAVWPGAEHLPRGQLVAFSTAVMVIFYFVTRVTNALHEHEVDLQQEQELRLRRERIEALGTLAAGAAHELATPLSTIAVAASELAHQLEKGQVDDETLEDARLIREQVASCRRILDQMTIDTGTQVGEPMVDISVGELLEITVGELVEHDRVDVVVGEELRDRKLFVPRTGLTMALRGIVKNAMDASADGVRVSLTAESVDGVLQLSIVDRGEGMNEAVLERALDPFFTTKEPGKGMGLGLFLARSTFERLGGSLRIESRPRVGTRVVVALPLEALERPADPRA
ncbi:MAG: HAMP domain-containing histidine kinase [Planctomycetes bacterium]|nr:HAMP domain-containing histidine kinase [Planctomycetota bacterium]MCB9903895.1 HAMP domain-containing histidine kinase [Planctomycetota bacterium]